MKSTSVVLRLASTIVAAGTWRAKQSDVRVICPLAVAVSPVSPLVNNGIGCRDRGRE